jgi:hypothetical protein
MTCAIRLQALPHRADRASSSSVRCSATPSQRQSPLRAPSRRPSQSSERWCGQAHCGSNGQRHKRRNCGFRKAPRSASQEPGRHIAVYWRGTPFPRSLGWWTDHARGAWQKVHAGLIDESKCGLREAVSGQIVSQIPLKVVRANMQSAGSQTSASPT